MGFWDFVKKVFAAEPESETPVSNVEASTPAAQNTSQDGPEANYDSPDILGLSGEAYRKQALKTKRWESAWSGRFDIIPPASDEHTQVVDRGMVLAGKTSQAELDQIHALGDEYLKYHRRDIAARVASDQAARDLSADLKTQKAQLKAQKKAESRAKRLAHAEGVAHRKATDIIYLGRGVSRGLADRRANPEKLEQLGLPKLATPADVARLLDLSIADLRWLAFFAEATDHPHYIPFEIKKRNGGTRQLAAPHAKLKTAQKAVLTKILEKLSVDPASHGFVKGRSTVTNADQHIGKSVVVCLDLKGFFPTITFHRVRGLFEHFGYSPAAATVLACLCTEAPRIEVGYEGTTYQVAVSDPALPQGAPTSPAISNFICHRLDRRLRGYCKKHGWTYTRYADDLTFSGGPVQAQHTPALIRMAQQVARDEGFAAHPAKTRVMRKGGRQLVTGIVVNQRRAVPKKDVRQLRAVLHNAKSTGLEAQNRDNHPSFKNHISGKIAYIGMVDPTLGKKLKTAFDELSV